VVADTGAALTAEEADKSTPRPIFRAATAGVRQPRLRRGRGGKSEGVSDRGPRGGVLHCRPREWRSVGAWRGNWTLSWSTSSTQTQREHSAILMHRH
jgi:hypothetical protein